MVLSASAVSLVSIAVTVLMVAAMLYLVWGSLDSEIHSPSPDDSGQPELGEGDETAEDQEGLPESNAA
ncbi:hypothetical protein [Halorubrum sp. 2020YC2]|uniref:hypothetical protein n=1 Tax=Halorubrum sp. 2020YC2 TaxID=2836432 RepID=UPI001BECF0F8|nr:hypothetical protein [Halorubrum sp. 2020YC2]QWC19102.1 hypothetical protein KI388_13435 [Halorubrum sp. 2020YC2]